MDRPRRGENARLIGAFRRDRGALFVTTALTAAVVTLFALPARGQLAPDTQPAGGAVVAGSARIAATPTTTTVTQSSARAAVNWQSFDVGSAATVDFVQPSANAVTLNRVMAADPSQIAGHIQANGGIVITNPAGVVFVQGSEVNAASVLVSAPGITNRNFMAGRMQFDIPPKPGARIANAGQITVKSAGLAALVAPEVVNSGVITAKLGQVILAGGAAAETLDLYGDGLVSLDVTPEAHATRLANGARATALVTNTGTIIASGGSVELTASQVDGLVQDLVDAGGTIAANSVGTHSGTIAITGIGGAIRIPGTLLAEGKAPGTSGGAIVLDATGSVTLTGSAAVDASGSAGGGTVAIGTTLARARGGPGTAATLTANSVSIAPGARIAASATDDGDGGRVTVLSLGDTAMSGTIQARGGRFGGNGGSVEISGENLTLDGRVDTSAPLGATGGILLDPYNLTIVATNGANDGDVTTTPLSGVAFSSGTTTAGSTDTVDVAAITKLTGNVTLQATNDLEIEASFTLNNDNGTQSLTLQAGNNVTIDPGVVVSATGNIEIDAASSATSLRNPLGTLIVQGTVQAGGNLSLSAGSGGIIISTGTDSTPGSISGTTVSITTTGPANDAFGSIAATTLSGSSVGASFTGSNNVGTLGSYNAGTSTFNLTDGSALTVSGSVQATDNLAITAGPSLMIGSGASLAAPGGNVSLVAGTGGVIIDGSIGGSPPPSSVSITTTGPANDAFGSIAATTLSGSSTGASFTGSNNVGTLGSYNAGTSTFNLTDGSALTVTGSVQATGNLAIEADSLAITGSLVALGTGGIVQLAPATATDAIELAQTSTSAPNTLVLTSGDLDGISADVLQIGTLGGGSITLDIPTIAIGTLDLVTGAESSVTENSALSVGELIGEVGSATLTQGNSITTLGGFTTSSGGFSLAEAGGQSLLVSGLVSVPNGNTIALTADGIAIGDGGSLSAAGATVTLAPATPGLALELTTGLASAQPGTFSLGDATQNTAAIGAGTVVVSNLLVEAGHGGAITVSGSIALPATTDLDLLSSGAVSEATTADSLGVGTLTANVHSASLIGDNGIGTLGAIMATGGFSLMDTQNLTLAGLLTAGSSGSVQLNDPGFAITESGGRIVAGTLTGSAASATFADANNVGTLGAFAASEGGFALAEATGQNLLVTGVVSVSGSQALALTADGIAIGSSGSLSAAGATVTLAPATPGLALDVTTGLASAQLGTFSLGDATQNTAAISAGTVVVSNVLVGTDNGGAITVSGSIALPATTDLDLLSSGAVSEATTADSLGVGTLTANVQSASLIGDNGIGTLGAIMATGGFSLMDTEDLTLAGLLTAGSSGSVQLNDPGFAIIEQTGSLAGSIEAGTLAGSAATATLANANEIGALGAFAASSGFSLTDQQALAITGALSAGTAPVSLVINGGSLIESGIGTITSGVLSGSASSVTLDNANSVATLGVFTSEAGFSLTELGGQTLSVTGVVSVPTGQTIALTTDGLQISGSLSAPGGTVKLAPTSAGQAIALNPFGLETVGALSINSTDLSLVSAATLEIGSASAGPILVGSPFGLPPNVNLVSVPSAVTSLVLDSGNAITEYGALSAPGATLSGFAGGGSLTVAAGMASFGSANTLASLGSFTALGGFTFTNAGDLLLAGPLDAGAATADLASVSGSIQEEAGPPAGTITAGTLDADAAGPIVLSEANSIGTLGAIAAPGGFTLDNPAGFFIAGNLYAGDATVLLTSSGSAVEDDGSITAGLLSGSLAAATLGGANDISDIAALTAHGGLSLTNEEALTISGAVDIGDASASFAINGASLLEAGAGVLTAGLIEGSAAGVSLSNSANAVGTLGQFSAPGGLALAVANGLAISGVVDTGAGAIDLTAGGSIAEMEGGALVGGALLGFAGFGTSAGAAGVANLTNSNTLASLGNFTALGGFSLADTGSLALLGLLDAGTADVVLTGGAAVSEPAGSITAANLSGTLASAALGGANRIEVLANFIVPGGFSLTDLEALTLSGPVSAGNAEAAFTVSGDLVENAGGVLAAGTLAGSAGMIDFANAANAISSLGAIGAPGGLTITTATGLAIGGLVTTSSAPMVLKVGGAIDEIPGGTVSGGALTGAASAASFANINTIGELSNFTAPGGFTFDNAGDLPVAGLLDAGPATALLVAGGSLFETTAKLLGETTAGAITAGTLAGSAGSVTLGATANRIADLGSFSAGAFDLTDGENLAVTGPVAGDPINLVVNGNLAIGGAAGAGVLTSSGPVFLTVSGAITEPDGAIDAASLSGSSASASLGGANQVPVLGVFSSDGSFLFNADEPTLTVNGPISAGSASLASTGSLVLAGLVSSGSATLSAGGPISEPGGAISAGSLAGAAASAALTATNTIDTLGSFSTPGTFLLADSAPLAVAGPVTAAFLGISDPAAISFTGSTNVGTLSVTAGGSITEPSGVVVAGLLEGSAVGLAQFGPDAPAGSASVTTLGPFSVAAGSFTLTDSLPLAITGPLNANYFAITAPGSIVLSHATITTLGLPVAEQSATVPARPGSFFSVTTAGGRFLELGRTTIDPAGGTNTVRIQLNPAGGVISFADLVAPNTTLILDTGAGTAVGTIDLGALIVIGNLGSSTLEGMVANLSGLVASSKATISPFQSPHYRLNSCPLMSVNCIFIAPEQVPQGNPLSNIAIVGAPPTQREIDLLLPNVAAQDY